MRSVSPLSQTRRTLLERQQVLRLALEDISLTLRLVRSHDFIELTGHDLPPDPVDGRPDDTLAADADLLQQFMLLELSGRNSWSLEGREVSNMEVAACLQRSIGFR